ncbi:MAG: S49 family peptidase, partial [Chloroflexota bacterium]
PLTEEAKQVLQGIVEESYRRFVTVVAGGRNLPEARIRTLADGRVYTGRQAKDAGLVDQLGDLPEAIDLAAELGGIKGSPRIVRYRSGGLLSGGAGNLLGLLPLTGLAPGAGGQSPFSLQYLYLVP